MFPLIHDSLSQEGGAKGQIPTVAEKVVLSQLPGPVRAEKCDLTLKPTLTEETVQENAELFFLTQVSLLSHVFCRPTLNWTISVIYSNVSTRH